MVTGSGILNDTVVKNYDLDDTTKVDVGEVRWHRPEHVLSS